MEATPTYVEGRVRTGTETIAYFIGASTCGASRYPRLNEALSRIRDSLSRKARADGKYFVYAGVALDEVPADGMRFLEPFGPFDEIMAGGSWLNSGSVNLMIRDLPGPLVMPQLVVVERDVKVGGSTIIVEPERVLARVLGFTELFRLAGIPQDSSR